MDENLKCRIGFKFDLESEKMKISFKTQLFEMSDYSICCDTKYFIDIEVRFG